MDHFVPLSLGCRRAREAALRDDPERRRGGALARITFEKSVLVSASLAAVYAHLAEPKSFLGLQPLLVELAETGRGVDARGRSVRGFQTVEQLRLAGLVPWRNRLTGTVALDPAGDRIDVEVRSRPGIVLRSTYRLREAVLPSGTAGTQVTERVEIDCPRLLAPFVRREADRAHEQLLQALALRLEAAT